MFIVFTFIFIFITFIEIPAPVMLAYWFVIQLFSGLGSIAQTHISQGGVAFFAHVGGFISGMLLVKILGTNDRYSRRRDYNWQ